ncbi:MAG: hypothetical protein EZS28_042405 [Streblomastix strix]|uniref:Uncharacterized protein n=1 Tax=Streblomastix strix TaxID=222440 RepID=A0A5J4TW04_9EUKA|nr:MAG: hypothetical protein EZS28_042405 [Streblomastix strix]
MERCNATSSSSSSSSSSTTNSGFGGGIFLTGSSINDVLYNGLDLRGMLIYKNNAANGGNSLYVVMAQLKEWCQAGNEGEHVKGNYSEETSQLNDLQGIEVGADQFDKLSLDDIKSQQVFLECYWSDKKDVCPSLKQDFPWKIVIIAVGAVDGAILIRQTLLFIMLSVLQL